MNARQLSRRTFLRGSMGVTLALPLLDSMTARGAAPERKMPRRVACVYFPNGVSLPGPGHPHHKEWHWFPHGTGKEFTFTKTLESLEPFRDSLSVLGGLSHTSGRKLPGHSVMESFLTGSDIAKANTISVDQLYAAKASQETRLPSLVLSSAGGIQAGGRPSTISYTKEGQPIPAEDNLRRLFNRLFGSTAETDQAARKTLAHQKSMLDLVLEDSKALNSKLGKDDQKKLDEYLSSVRDLEGRVTRTEKWLDVPKAKVDAKQVNLDVTRDAPKDYIRGMYDLMYLAFLTDTTRAASYAVAGEGTSFANEFPKAIGLPGIHTLSHSTNKSADGFKNWARWDQFLAEQFAYFLTKLKDTREGDGTLLDRTLLLYGCSTSTTHLARNYPLILAGGREMGVKHGGYHVLDENKRRMSDLFVTMLNALGVETKQFGESTTNLNELLA
jgi:hypothetical protein